MNQTILLPLFDEARGTGNNAEYHVYGYAAFKLTGYHFGGQYRTEPKPLQRQRPMRPRLLHQFVDLSDAFDYGADAPDSWAPLRPPTDPKGSRH